MSITVKSTYTDLTIDPNTEVLRFPSEVRGILPRSLDHLTNLHTIWWGPDMMDPIEPGTIPDRPIVLFMPKRYPHQITDNVPARVAICIYSGSIDFSKPSNLPSRPIFFSYGGGERCYGFPGGLHVSRFQCSEYGCKGAVVVYRSSDDKFTARGSPTINTFADYWNAMPKPEPKPKPAPTMTKFDRKRLKFQQKWDAIKTKSDLHRALMTELRAVTAKRDLHRALMLELRAVTAKRASIDIKPIMIEPTSDYLKRKQKWDSMVYKERIRNQTLSTKPVVGSAPKPSPEPAALIEPISTDSGKIEPVLDYAKLQELKAVSDKIALKRLSATALSLAFKIKKEIELASTNGTLASYYYSRSVLPCDTKLVNIVREYLPCLAVTFEGGMMRVRV